LIKVTSDHNDRDLDRKTSSTMSLVLSLYCTLDELHHIDPVGTKRWSRAAGRASLCRVDLKFKTRGNLLSPFNFLVTWGISYQQD